MAIERTVVDMDFLVTNIEIDGEASSPYYSVILKGFTRCPCNPSCFQTPNQKFRLKLVEVIGGDVVSTTGGDQSWETH